MKTISADLRKRCSTGGAEMTSYNDRVEGVLLATAAGDALGAPYEFKPPRGPELEVAMVGGGVWERGEWTDDTSMAIAIAEVAATGADLLDESAQDAIVQRWLEWSRDAKDVGIQTGSVLRVATRGGVITAASARAESEKFHRRSGRTGGNGALMRTAPVALAYLDDEDAMVEAARAISELTHFEPDAGDACVLWCSAIRHAVLTGKLDVRVGLPHIESGRRDVWVKRLDDAESARPASFPNNGWVVTALQAAWSAIATTPVPEDDPDAERGSAQTICVWRSTRRCRAERHRHGRGDRGRVARRGVRGVGGAGCVATRAAWLAGDRRHDLAALATAIGRNGKPDGFDFSYPGRRSTRFARHPYDDGVLLGGIGILRKLPRRSTRWYRCAGSPTGTCVPTYRTSRCG